MPILQRGGRGFGSSMPNTQPTLRSKPRRCSFSTPSFGSLSRASQIFPSPQARMGQPLRRFVRKSLAQS